MMSAWANQKGLSTNELNALLTRHSLACVEAAVSKRFEDLKSAMWRIVSRSSNHSDSTLTKYLVPAFVPRELQHLVMHGEINPGGKSGRTAAPQSRFAASVCFIS